MEVRVQAKQVQRRSELVVQPGEVVPDVERIVVARRDRLGDFVLTLPALEAIRRTYPGARLAALVNPAIAPLARLVDGVDEIWEAPGREADLVRRLREDATDLVVAISRDVGTAWAAWRARVPHRVGSARRAYSVLFTDRVVESRRAGGRHEVEFALSFAHRCGATTGAAAFGLSVTPDATAAVTGFCEEHGLNEPFVVVHPGSGGSCPRWPERHFARLIETLHSRRVAVALSLGPGERFPALAGGVATFAEDLPRLAALLQAAGLVVGNSSGPVHLAAALGTPTLALHAPWLSCSVERFGPYAGNGFGLVAEHESAYRWSRSERKRRGAELLAAIPPDGVAEAVLALLEGRQPPPFVP